MKKGQTKEEQKINKKKSKRGIASEAKANAQKQIFPDRKNCQFQEERRKGETEKRKKRRMEYLSVHLILLI